MAASFVRIASRLQALCTARSYATASKLIFRNATLKEADLLTRRVIQEGWHIGPKDFPSFLSFDPQSYYLGEVNGEVVVHFGVINFPKSHYHAGAMITTEKHRKHGYAMKCLEKGLNVCDTNYTIGSDVTLESKPVYESLGCKKHWDTYTAMFDLNKIVKNTADLNVPGVVTKPISKVNLSKLLEYDHTVFGTPREVLMTKWMQIPGSFGWAAINEESDFIVGYTVVKQAIRDAGTELGLGMAPLYADNAQIAKLLLKTAAENCLSNEAVPKTGLELVHPVGGNCEEGPVELMEELGADLTHIAVRMYTKGLPPGRQIKKIYGIISPSCD